MENIQELKSRLDTRDMYGMIVDMARHLEDGLALGLEVDLQGLEEETFQTVVLAGMGGSAIGGDIVESYLRGQMAIPLRVCRHYRLPGFVNKKALVICSSYSGNTEETLAAFDDAVIRGAKIIVLSSGGKLQDKARAAEIPIVSITAGLPPRAALGYSVASLLVILWRLGLCDDQCDELRGSVASLRKWAPAYVPEYADNPALDLARQIQGSIPVIYSGYDKFDAVAGRFRTQANENAKTLAFSNVFPELSHNEIIGWDALSRLDGRFTVVILKDTQDHRRLKVRMEIVARYLKNKGIKVVVLESKPGTDLERIFYFVQLLDFTCYYLALLNGVDPFPITAIESLKDELSKIN